MTVEGPWRGILLWDAHLKIPGPLFGNQTPPVDDKVMVKIIIAGCVRQGGNSRGVPIGFRSDRKSVKSL